MSKDAPSAQTTQKHEIEHGRRRHGAALFIGQWQLWFGALPLAGSVGHMVAWGITSIAGHRAITWPGGHVSRIHIGLFEGTGVAVLIAVCAMVAAGILAGIALHIAFKVTGRVPFVAYHVALTPIAAAVMLSITTGYGWSITWAILHLTGSSVGAFGWNLYKTDALRSDKSSDDKSGNDSLSKLFGLKPDAVVVGQPKTDDHFITAKLDPGMGGVPGDVDGALEALEQQVKPALPARSWTERVPGSKLVKLVMMHNDPLKPWPLWGGPYNLGGSFEDGARCGRYADNMPEIVRLAKWIKPAEGPDDEPEEVMPAGAASVGATRTGKSGHAAVLWTELVWTSNDAGLIYLDGAKPGQSMAGQVMEDLVLFAGRLESTGSVAPMLDLLDVIGSKLVPYRSKILGAAGHRDWSHQAFLDTGLCALLVAVDEGDLIAGSRRFRDMVTKCLSVGIFFHLVIPRMDGESLDTTARTAIGQTFAFGQGDDYSDDMAITPATKKRIGKKLANWGARYPGYHIYDGAGGIDENRWAMDVRSERAEFDQLKAAIIDGRDCRAHGGRVLTPGEIEVLGKAWTAYAPPGGRYWEHETPAAPAGARGAEGERKGSKMINTTRIETTESDDPYSDRAWRQADPDEDIPVPLPDEDDREPGDVETYSDQYRDRPVNEDDQVDGDDEPWSSATGTKERAPSPEAARTELHRAIRAIVSRRDEPTGTFGNAELIEEYRYLASEGWFSEYLYACHKGEPVAPPGIMISNQGRGRWSYERLPGAVIEGAAAPGR